MTADNRAVPGTALVTGASAGIGAAFARALAARGHDLILTARREDRLQALARAVSEAHGTQCRIVVADLAEADGVRRIAEAVEQAPAWVINNAGYGVAGKFNAVDWSTHEAFLRVMVTAVVELSYRLLPAMQHNGSGHIVNVASLAGLVPGSAGHTLYGASKAFLVKFSESLAAENRDTGVKVAALCPGFTYSEFHDVTGTRDQVSKMPDRMWMTAEAVVDYTLEQMAREAPLPVLIPGRINRNIDRMMRWLPKPLAYGIIARRSKQFRKTD